MVFFILLLKGIDHIVREAGQTLKLCGILTYSLTPLHQLDKFLYPLALLCSREIFSQKPFLKHVPQHHPDGFFSKSGLLQLLPIA